MRGNWESITATNAMKGWGTNDARTDSLGQNALGIGAGKDRRLIQPVRSRGRKASSRGMDAESIPKPLQGVDKGMSEKELAMTKEQYDTVMDKIWWLHRFSGVQMHHKHPQYDKHLNRCKYIKYVRPNWDMRDGMCFSIRFDGLTCGKDGTTFGVWRETEPMFDRIMAWLNTPNEELRESEEPE